MAAAFSGPPPLTTNRSSRPSLSKSPHATPDPMSSGNCEVRAPWNWRNPSKPAAFVTSVKQRLWCSRRQVSSRDRRRRSTLRASDRRLRPALQAELKALCASICADVGDVPRFFAGRVFFGLVVLANPPRDDSAMPTSTSSAAVVQRQPPQPSAMRVSDGSIERFYRHDSAAPVRVTQTVAVALAISTTGAVRPDFSPIT